ncbi:hypothetical protein P8605_30460 [Streptomyces sp. T-3]|nr:hypothetical protein [Streptomyces sp. T-3]
MKASVSRGVVAAVAVAALGLTVAGCGGESGKGEGAEKPSPSKGGAAAQADKPKKAEAAAALSQAQLDKAVLGKGDVKGYEITKLPKERLLGESFPADPEDCQPVADMFMFVTQPGHKARVGRDIAPDQKDAIDATSTSMVLLAQEQADAEKVMAGLEESLEECGGKYEHAFMKYDGLKAMPGTKVGDESVSYIVSSDFDGEKLPMRFTVVRSGSTLIALTAMNLLEPEKAEVPESVIDAQIVKLKNSGK